MDVKGDGRCIMELARMLSPGDVCRILKHTSEVQLPLLGDEEPSPGDISSSKRTETDVSKEDGTPSEPNNIQFIRLPLHIQDSLSTTNGPGMIELLNNLLDDARKSEEFYSSPSKEEWLGTEVNSELPMDTNEQWLRTEVKSESPMGELQGYGKDERSKHITIRSNVVPCKAYRENIPEDYNEGSWYLLPLSPEDGIEHSVFQKTRDQQQKTLTAWINKEMVGQTDVTPRPLRRKIEPSDEDLKKTKVRLENKEKARLESKRSKIGTSSSPLSRFQEEFWQGGLFGVKVFKRDANKSFVQEVRVRDRIGTHPHIVHIFGLSEPKGEDGYRYWMKKMESDLDKILTKDLSGGNSKSFSVDDQKHILLQIAKAMQHLHESEVIHGDLKPANILVSRSEGLGGVKLYTVKVADFGNAIIIEQGATHVCISGTEEYAAPEVLKELLKPSPLGYAKVSVSIAEKCDVYSFGIVAVEVLEGQKVKKHFKDILKPSKVIEESEKVIKEHLEDIKERVEAIRKSDKYSVRLVNLVARCLDLEPSPPHSFKYVPEGSGPSNRHSFAEVTRELECIDC